MDGGACDTRKSLLLPRFALLPRGHARERPRVVALVTRIPLVSDPDFTLYAGDALDVLRGLADASVDCCVTSPPYWGLRDYDVDGQLGLEPTPKAYVDVMVEVFREVRRVLRSDGTIRAAGFTPNKCGTRPWTRDAIADAMLDHLLRTGKWPSSADWSKPVGDEHRPSRTAVHRQFKTWRAAKLYAGWTGQPGETYVRPSCSECGTELENTTLGCGACASRAHSKRKRTNKAEPAALMLAREATGSDERKVAA